ncbi:MAG: hypothetical protein IPG14_19020, partial [Dehalococcoidia bacterium]|nr:hypothetical protein [Dehalococcoidia bacterium]
MTRPRGGRFVLALGSVDAQITLGAPALRGRATAGWELSATITAAGGSPVKSGPSPPVATAASSCPSSPWAGPSPWAATWTSEPREAATHQLVLHHINQVKDITVTLDRSSDLATGTAPAGEAVILNAEDMDGRQELFRATADGAGAFSVAMAPA